MLSENILNSGKELKAGSMQYERYYSLGLFILVIGLVAGLVVPVQGQLDIPPGWMPTEATLTVTDNLSAAQKELIVETDEWKVIFSLFYNGGIYRLFDKVYDPTQSDNLATGPWYTQGSIFDYDVYLIGGQEFMTTVGKNNAVGRATLVILENTPVRLRFRQFCHPRLNNGQGPPGDIFLELDMVEATTDWTFYPTGSVYIKFDAVEANDWDGIVSQEPGGGGKGIDANGTAIITATNGTNFLDPWVTQGDTIESSTGGWGPVEIASRLDQSTLQLVSSVGSGTNLDYTIRRPYIENETISIHADGDPNPAPFTSYWQGGSDGDPLYDDDAGGGNKMRNPTPPVAYDYAYVHWTKAPREYGSLLTFNEVYTGANYAVLNAQCCTDISYTQVGRGGVRSFEEHHRHFMAHMGTENGQVLPQIKSVADALPLADDYKNPYAEARAGTLDSGAEISAYGFHLPSGAYHISVDVNNVAEIAFDTMRGGSVAYAYYQPAVLVSELDVNDLQLNVQLSQDNGATFYQLPDSWYNVTSKADSAELGSPGKRLIQLLCSIPATATGSNKWVLRISGGGVNFIEFAVFAEQWLKSNCGSCGGADFTNDGNVNLSDLEQFAKSWLGGDA
ncbi:MAG: hypothetical protein PVG93_06980 [Phycisphaerales bacterium]